MSFSVFYLLWCILILVPPILGLFPPLKEGRAHNHPFAIHMPDPAQTYGDRWYFILVQEIVEWYGEWLMCLLVAAVPSFVLSLYFPMEVWASVAVVLTMACHGLRKIGWIARQFEYLGHASELVDGRNAGHSMYVDENAFADRMRLGYRMFIGMSREQVLKGIHAWTPVARAITFMTQVWLSDKRRV